MAKNLFSQSFTLTKQLVRIQLAPLLFLLVVGSVLNLYLEGAMRDLTPADENSRWTYQLGLGLWDLFEGIMLFLILSWGVPKVRDLVAAHLEKHPFTEPYLGSFFAEYLRMLAQVLLYFLLLILPAVIRYCRLIFVTYIALFCAPYRRNEVDAVELSLELTRKHFWLILGVFVATTALQVGIEFLPQMFTPLYNVPCRVLFMTTGLLISIWTYSFIYLLFEQSLEEKSWT